MFNPMKSYKKKYNPQAYYENHAGVWGHSIEDCSFFFKKSGKSYEDWSIKRPNKKWARGNLLPNYFQTAILNLIRFPSFTLNCYITYSKLFFGTFTDRVIEAPILERL